MVKLDLDLDPDPDPHSEKLLDPDPDPHKMNADPQPCLRVELFFIDSSSGGGEVLFAKTTATLSVMYGIFWLGRILFTKKVVLAISKFLIKMTQIVIMCFMMMEYHCEVLLLLMKNSYYAICQLMICQLVEILMKYLNKYNIGN